MHHELKQKVIYLRTKKHLSYSSILKRVPVAKSTLSVWLRAFPLSKRRILKLKRAAWKRSEVKIELFRAAMREKKELREQEVYEKYYRQFAHISNASVFVAGLMLYLAEGTKVNTGRIALANTDSRICRFFVRWLEKFYKIPRERIRIHLQLYPTMNKWKEINFWERELGIPKSQFYKPFLRKLTRSSFSYQESFRHGTCTVIILGVQIQREILMAIKAYMDAALK